MNKTENKRMAENKTNTANIYNTLSFLNTPVSLSQYLIYNLFRVLRPVRYKYKLTINEIIILNGMMIYNKFVGSSFAYSAIMRYVGYFNDNKMRYYFGTLQEKGMIVNSDVLNGNKRYKLTEEGVNCITYIEECFNVSLDKFINDNGISL